MNFLKYEKLLSSIYVTQVSISSFAIIFNTNKKQKQQSYPYLQAIFLLIALTFFPPFSHLHWHRILCSQRELDFMKIYNVVE